MTQAHPGSESPRKTPGEKSPGTESNEEAKWRSEQRTRTAIHEASHAAMAFELGRPIEVVSIRPGKHYGGVAPYRPALYRGDRKFGLPAILQPAASRRAIETQICVSLAGQIGEDLLWPHGRWGMSEDERQAETAVREFARLSKRETALLTALEERDEPLTSDEANASELAEAMSEAEAGDHLAYLRAVTKSIISSPGFLRLVDALVPVLLDQTAVSGRAVREIFRSVDMKRRPLAVAARG